MIIGCGVTGLGNLDTQISNYLKFYSRYLFLYKPESEPSITGDLMNQPGKMWHLSNEDLSAHSFFVIASEGSKLPDQTQKTQIACPFFKYAKRLGKFLIVSLPRRIQGINEQRIEFARLGPKNPNCLPNFQNMTNEVLRWNFPYIYIYYVMTTFVSEA